MSGEAQPESMRGFLQKKGPRGVHSWKTRWFVLQDNKLAYYKTQGDPAPIATLNLELCTSMWGKCTVAPKGKVDCTFAMDIQEHKKTRTYYLAANSQSERDKWLEVMLRSKKYHEGQLTAKPEANTSSKELIQLRAALEKAERRKHDLEGANARLRIRIDGLQAQMESGGASPGGSGGGNASGEDTVPASALADVQQQLLDAKEELDEERRANSQMERELDALRQQTLAAKGGSSDADAKVEQLTAEVRELKRQLDSQAAKGSANASTSGDGLGASSLETGFLDTVREFDQTYQAFQDGKSDRPSGESAAETQRLRTEAAELREQLTQAQASLTAVKMENKTLATQKRERAEQVKRLQRNMQDLRTKLAKARADSAQAGSADTAALDAAQAELADAQRDRDTAQQQCSKLETQLKQAQGKNEELQGQIVALKADSSAAADSSATITTLKAEMEELKGEAACAKEDKDAALELVKSLEGEVEELRGKLEQAQQEAIAANAATKEAKAAAAAAAAASGGGGGDGLGDTAMAEMQEQMEAMEMVLADLEQENQDLQQRLAASGGSGGGGGGGGDDEALADLQLLYEADKEDWEAQLAKANDQCAKYKSKLSLLRKEYKKLAAAGGGGGGGDDDDLM